MKDAVDILNARVKELEAEHRDCLQTITDMQSKWEELKAENEKLEAECNSLAAQLNQCNERGGRILAENYRLGEKLTDSDCQLADALLELADARLEIERLRPDDAIDAAREDK
jgi:predicted nuclease with TOPRIM domain